MPELIERHEANIVKTIRHEVLTKGIRLREWEVARLVENYDGDLISCSGAECVIVGVRGQPKKILAIPYWELKPERAREIFFLQRIFSTLFPHNFPHFYAVFWEHPQMVGKASLQGTIRERIIGQILDHPQIATARLHPGSRIEHPFQKVLKFCNDFSIPVWFDSYHLNYLLAEDGGVYYLDTVKTETKGKWNLSGIMEYIEMEEDRFYSLKPVYDNLDKRVVRRSIERLVELGLIRLAS